MYFSPVFGTGTSTFNFGDTTYTTQETIQACTIIPQSINAATELGKPDPCIDTSNMTSDLGTIMIMPITLK